MHSTKRKNIALLIESSRAYGRNLLRGVAKFSQSYANWCLLHQEMTIDADLPQWLRRSSVDGVIARVDNHNIEALRSLMVPIVDVRCRRTYQGIPGINTDDCQVAELAFEHLRDCGFRQFAFCGYMGAGYSNRRLRRFQELAKAKGLPLMVYEEDSDPSVPITEIESLGLAHSRELTRWLSSLPIPTGLLACNDIRGQQVLNVCRQLEIQVPDDLAVVGVDDDHAICPVCDPPLSSVRPNAERVGYRAAETLNVLMKTGQCEALVKHIPATGVVRRLSTNVTAVEDREIARICRHIRENACDGIDVSDVVQFSTLSRRQLERRFRAALNRTLHDELVIVQISKAKLLLSETDLTLERLAPLVGFSHKERFSVVFKKRTGMTPGEYRRRCRLQISQPDSVSDIAVAKRTG